MEIGTLLFTKNGQKIGNAIVLEIDVDKYNREHYRIKTDFGNVLVLSEDDIERLFITSDDILYPTFGKKSVKDWLWNRFCLSFKF